MVYSRLAVQSIYSSETSFFANKIYLMCFRGRGGAASSRKERIAQASNKMNHSSFVLARTCFKFTNWSVLPKLISEYLKIWYYSFKHKIILHIFEKISNLFWHYWINQVRVKRDLLDLKISLLSSLFIDSNWPLLITASIFIYYSLSTFVLF